MTFDIQRKYQYQNHSTRKFFIFMLIFLVLWNATKIPFYIAWNEKTDPPLASTINLQYFLPGFNGTMLRAPPCNFLLLHIAFGSTVLIMMALSLIKPAWRKKYGKYFFSFSLCLALHTVPAAVNTPSLALKFLFTFTCFFVSVFSICGFKTLYDYDKDPEQAEKHLFIEYCVISFGAYGAGFAESAGIAAKFIYKFRNGEFPVYNIPDPLYGKLIYSMLPEKYGLTLFFIFTGIVWLYWPLSLLDFDLRKPYQKIERVPTEDTMLISDTIDLGWKNYSQNE